MEIARLNADPFNPEAQAKIAELIRQENVEKNWEAAMEFNPESFGRVVMLYIDCEVNGVPLKAFVDCGAQTTIMSAACAERAGLMRLLDTRYAGMAQGIGTARILGRIHVAPIKIGGSFFSSSFTVLEGRQNDLLLGLDMLKKHQCNIDLHANVLRIGDEAAPFLAEKDIPKTLLAGEALGEGASTSTPPPATSTSSSLPPTLGTSPTTTTGGVPRGIPSLGNPSSPGNPSLGSASTSAPPPHTSAAPPSSIGFPRASVQTLTDLGFSESQAVSALTSTRGNVEQAASLLFSSSGF